MTVCGAAVFCRRAIQGVKFRNQGDPVLDISDPGGVSRDMRRLMLDSLSQINHIKHERGG